MKKCRNEHVLKLEDIGELGYICDGCKEYFDGKNKLILRYQCKECDFDHCIKCYKSMGKF